MAVTCHISTTRNGNKAKTTIGRTVAQVVISSSRTSSIEDTYHHLHVFDEAWSKQHHQHHQPIHYGIAAIIIHIWIGILCQPFYCNICSCSVNETKEQQQLLRPPSKILCCPKNGDRQVILRRVRKRKVETHARIFAVCKVPACPYFSWADHHLPNCSCRKKGYHAHFKVIFQWREVVPLL